MEALALRLLNQFWPLEPCRKTSVSLANLKDEHGNKSESTHFTTKRTGGMACLGGGWKERNFEADLKQFDLKPKPESAFVDRKKIA